jgi:hypothetical protein
MFAHLGLGLLLAGASLGRTPPDHGRNVSCYLCGTRTSIIGSKIEILQRAPNWRMRDNAAHDLRKFSWKCHPEVALALVDALLNDCKDEVREEAAESLTKMKACLPEVHVALKDAAIHDPDSCTRREARKGLSALGQRCVGVCSLCPTEEVELRYEMPPSTIPPDYVPPVDKVPAEEGIAPPTEMPPPAPAAEETPILIPNARRSTEPTTAARRVAQGKRSNSGVVRSRFRD